MQDLAGVLGRATLPTLRQENKVNNKESKVVGCLVCGYRTAKPEEVARFESLDFFCCKNREELAKAMNW